MLIPRTILQSVIRRNYKRPSMPMSPGSLKLLQKSRQVKRDRMGKNAPANAYFQGKYVYSVF